MELALVRYEFYPLCCIGKLYKGNQLICYTLEDKDRGLTSEMSITDLILRKVVGKTAIPYGRYEITVTYSNRFKRNLPLLNSVKAFSGIRIHAGNKAEDTEGCLLVGEEVSGVSILKSKIAFEEIYNVIGKALLNEKVFITIRK